MGIMAYSLLWVMQDLYHQSYDYHHHHHHHHHPATVSKTRGCDHNGYHEKRLPHNVMTLSGLWALCVTH